MCASFLTTTTTTVYPDLLTKKKKAPVWALHNQPHLIAFMVHGLYFWSAAFAPESWNSETHPDSWVHCPASVTGQMDVSMVSAQAYTHSLQRGENCSQKWEVLLSQERQRIHHLAECLPPFITEAPNTITQHKPRFEWHHSLSLETVACHESVQSGCAEGEQSGWTAAKLLGRETTGRMIFIWFIWVEMSAFLQSEMRAADWKGHLGGKRGLTPPTCKKFSLKRLKYCPISKWTHMEGPERERSDQTSSYSWVK